MAGSSKGFYMKDGRLFESVFFDRGGNQDFGLYADDGTDLGRKFYQGVGHHETGYKRSDGVDIGSLLFDNTEPVQGYITHNIPNNIVDEYWYHPMNSMTCDYYRANVETLIFIAHPQRGSGIYSYSWTWWDASGQDGLRVLLGTYKQVITTTASTFSLPYKYKYDKTNGYYGLHWKYDAEWAYKKGVRPYICCNITDGATGNVASPAVTFGLHWSCTYCNDNCSDCD